MNLDVLLKKIAQNQSLTPQELDELGRFGVETQQRNSFIAGNTTPQNQLNINFPFFPIFSEVLTVDMASIEVQIPGDYKHLMIFGQGRVSAANGGNVWCQFNRDTGSNYSWTVISGNGATSGSAEDTSDTHAALGLFSNTGDPAGSASSFEAKIMHYISPFHQMVLANTYYSDNTTRTLYSIGSKWASTDTIKSIEIYATDNTLAKGTTNILAGSVISIYGIL